MPAIRRSAALAALTLCVMTGACSGENPTAPPAAPSVPRLDGGATFGSGSFTGNNTTTAADSGTTATRGGATLGSGS